MIKFSALCKDQDRQYEMNNNCELDNGVYHKFVYSSSEDENAKNQENQQQDQISQSVKSSSRNIKPTQ